MKRIIYLLLSLTVIFGAVFIAPVSAEEGWNGTTATAPDGSGTKSDPYQISSAANLLWMSKQLGTGSADEEVKNFFAGKYLEQTADIDLNGKTLLSIGYYYSNPNKMVAFGGYYNGNGFVIKNGTIREPNQDSARGRNAFWGSGLFGAIYGATIKNVVLENVTVTGLNIVGGIVGVAGTPDGDYDASFNIIENCVIKNDCKVQATEATLTSDNVETKVGGIIGSAKCVTIKYCINNALVTVPGNILQAAGIAGAASRGIVIQNCVNNGTIQLDSTLKSMTVESAFGGIVGRIHPFGPTAVSAAASVLIKDCYNTGSFHYKGANIGADLAWGGIIGSTNTLSPGTSYTIENCYNLNAENNFECDQGTRTRVGGIVGSGWHGANSAATHLMLKDSFSVQITKGGNTKTTYNYTNEYVVSPNKNATDNVAILTDNVSTKTESEIRVFTDIIDARIENANKLITHGYQLSSIEGGKFNIRLVFGLENLNYSEYGFKIVKDGDTANALTKTSTTVYTAINGYQEDGTLKVYTAEELGSTYLTLCRIEGILASGNYIFEIEGLPLILKARYSRAKLVVTVTNGTVEVTEV